MLITDINNYVPRRLLSRTSKSTAKQVFIWKVILVCGLFAHIAYFTNSPFISFLTILFFLITPGYLLLSLINLREESKWVSFSYSLGLSLLFLIIAGLLLNSLHVFGISRPLTSLNIFISLDIIIFFLTFLVRKKVVVITSITKPTLEKFIILVIALLLPILAAAGAIRLNNDASNILTLITYFIAPLLLLYMFVKYRTLKSIIPLIIFLIGLALLLSVSLRGNGIIGHDIIREFYVFQLTAQKEYWTIDVFKNTYNSCLSITILPTIFLKVSHISDIFIFKFVFQFIFATILIPIYLFMKKYTGEKAACLGILIFISFPVFYNDMPFLNRQEIALLFFSLIILVLSHAKVSIIRYLFLATLFTVGMILSHYTSSYVAIAIAALTWVIYFIRGYSAFRLKDRTLYVSLGLIVLSLVLAFTWNSQITKTSDGLVSTINKAVDDIKNIGNRTTSLQTKTQSQELYNAAGEYRSNVEYVSQNPETSKIPFLGSVINSIYSFVDNKKSLIVVFIVFAWLLWQLFKRRLIFDVQMSVVLSALIIISIQILIPHLTIDYGAERLFQQLLILLLIPFVSMLAFIGKKLMIKKVIVLTTVVYFYVLSGFLPQLTGSYYPKVALNNSGQTYDIYYQKAGEQISLKWLDKQYNSIPLTSFDYSGIYKLRLYDQSVFRRTVPPYGENGRDFLYKSSFNIDSGLYIYRGDTSNIYYRVKNPPVQNILYSNNDSEISGPTSK